MQNLESGEMECDLGLVGSFIAADKKDEFVSLIKGQLESDDSWTCSLKIRELLNKICLHEATKCATALIAGETGLQVDLNAALIGGEYPLHLAARNLSFEPAKLFLENGARTNVVTNDEKLPLQVALETISCHAILADWSPKESIFKLIYLLCLPYLYKPLEVAKFVCIATATEDVKKVARNCVEEGNLVQLAVLLMVDRGKLLLLPGHESDICTLGSYIINKWSSIICEKYNLIAYGKYRQTRPHQHMRNVMHSAILLLQVFETAGGAIQNYCFSKKDKVSHDYMVADDVTSLLREFRFLGPHDHIFTLTQLQKDYTDKLDKSILHLMPSMQCLSEPFKRVSNEGRSSTFSEFTPPPVPCQLVRSFHTCTRPITASDVKLLTAAQTQVDGIITQVMHPVVPKFMTAMRIGVQALGIKKRNSLLRMFSTIVLGE